MEKIKTILKKPEYIVGICLLIVWIVFMAIYYVSNRYLDTIDELGEVYAGEMYCAVEIGDDEEHADRILIEGYCALPGESIATTDITLILWNEEQGMGYVVSTKNVERTDVTEAYNDGFDYNHSGFSATVAKDDLEAGTYQIYIQYRNNENDLLVGTESVVER